jgi:hypothetical protein
MMNSHTLVHLFHIIIVGILFLYVGIIREKIYKPVFNILFFLGLFIVFYHLYKIYEYLNIGKSIYINLIHIFIVAPLLIYIGYTGEKTSRKFFEMLLMLAFSSIGYHLYYFFNTFY